MNKLKWIAAALIVMMVLAAYVGAIGMNAQYSSSLNQLEKIGKGCLTVAAGLAVVFSWLLAKLEKPLRMLDICAGVSIALALVALRGFGEAMKDFALILVLLLVIIWLISSMIRRQITEKK